MVAETVSGHHDDDLGCSKSLNLLSVLYRGLSVRYSLLCMFYGFFRMRVVRAFHGRPRRSGIRLDVPVIIIVPSCIIQKSMIWSEYEIL